MTMSRSEAGRLGAIAKAKAARSKYEENPKPCEECEELLPWESRFNRFCCRSCAAINRNRGKRRHGRGPRECLCCNRETRNPKFCSNACRAEYNIQQTFKRYDETGIADGEPRTVKKYLIGRRGRRCVLCGGTKWRGQPMPLVLDHINGNADDNSVGNLRLVCGNCDMLLPTYSGRNRGNGRVWRRERRKSGKNA